METCKILLKKTVFMGVLLMLCSCTAYRLDNAQQSLRSTFASQNYDQTIRLLEKYENKGIYKDRDRVLYNLEMGVAQHFSERYDSSSAYFTKAEEQMDKLYTKSISRGIQSFLFTNDNLLEYNGEDYEDIYLNAFKSLNFIHRQNLDAALVEARRIAFKLSQLEIKYKGIAKALQDADSLGRADWKAGEANVQNSAFGHYLAAILYAKSDKPDDARIEYEKMLAAFRDQPGIYNFQEPDRESLRRIQQPQTYNVLLTGFAGRAPIKRQNDVRTYLPEEDLYLKFSLPSLHMYHSQVHRVRAVIDDSLAVEVPLIEEMDVVAREIYKVKEPIIYARALARSLVKAIGVTTASKAIKKENKDLGFLANIFGKIGQEISEKADLRSWQTLPGRAYVTVLALEPGSHSLKMEYLGSSGRLLYSDQQDITIRNRDELKLFETLYWN